MYLSDLIREPATEILREKCVGKRVVFTPFDTEEDIEILCKDVELVDDDGNVWIKFTSDTGVQYYAEGQGIDVWFDIRN